tara:strand:+ start:15933 stop:16601 length:669 start_codon:yes stop_codon:yes gene_type:complete
MDAVVICNQLLDKLIIFLFGAPRLRPVMRLRQSDKLAVVAAHRTFRPFLEVFLQMLERRDGAVLVEGMSFIRQRHEDDAAWPKNARGIVEKPDRVLEMLDDMVRNDEILRGVPDCRKRLGIVNDVRFDGVRALGFREVLVKLFLRHPVYIFDHNAWRYGKRTSETANLDPGALNVARRENEAIVLYSAVAAFSVFVNPEFSLEEKIKKTVVHDEASNLKQEM